MQLEGIFPNAITFICSLKACGSAGAIRLGKKIHCQIERMGLLKKNAVLGNALVDMYIKCNAVAYAHQVFDKLSVRNVVSWTSLLAGYSEHGHGETALVCYDHMQLEGVSPNSVTFIFCLKACASIRSADKGEELQCRIESDGLLEGDAILGNALVDMYAACGMFDKAQEVFDKIANQNVVSWTSLIARFAQHGYTDKALDCFKHMQRKGVYPNDVTLVILLKVCGSIGAIDMVQDLHSEIYRRGLFESNLVGNALVFSYSKCGFLAQAHEVFDMLHTQDIVSWNSLIAGYTQVGETENALSVYDQMLDQGLRPGSVTFTIVLSACNRQGSLCKSETYLEAMSKDYGIVSSPEHICSILSILFAGQVSSTGLCH
ncbi:hypothetical protein GOP47_0027062 [Adiantum capillus-veneris]|nr:hypothetical protein GOP47_0027062 [Adiantum capillus-veneris]